MTIFVLTQIARIAGIILLGILTYLSNAPIFITAILVLAAGILIMWPVCAMIAMRTWKLITQKRQGSGSSYSEKQDTNG